MEELRRQKTIGSSLDAQLMVTASKGQKAALDKQAAHLREFFMVSQIQIKDGAELHIEAVKAAGEKCLRCWNYDTLAGPQSPLPGMCPKCVEALT